MLCSSFSHQHLSLKILSRLKYKGTVMHSKEIFKRIIPISNANFPQRSIYLSMTMITFNKRLGQSAHLSKVLENNTMYIPSNPGGELY